MLVLTRRTGETLMIDKDIFITILATKGRQVRVGIAAPQEVKIYREEIYKRIKKEEQLEDETHKEKS